MPKALKIFQDDDNGSFALDQISVASPCHAEWEDMVGSDKVRFCASCQKNVFNLSGMKRTEAIDLLRATEGKVCVRFFRRADGTVLTEDCPVGVALLVRKAKRATLAAAAISIGAVAAMLAVLGGSFTKKTCNALVDVKTTIEQSMPDIPEPRPTMGEAPMEPPPPTMGVPPPPPEVKGRVKLMGKPVMLREEKGDYAPPPPQDRPHVEEE